MVELRHVATRQSAPAGYLIGLSDIVLETTSAGLRLYCVNTSDGGALVLGTDAAMTVLDQTRFASATSGLDAARQIIPTMINGAQALVSVGQYGTTLDILPLAANGLIGTAYTMALRGAEATRGAGLAIETFNLGNTKGFALASRQAEGLSLWRAIGGNQLQSIEQDAEAKILPAGGIAALRVHQTAAGTYLLALSAENEGLFSYLVDAAGGLTLAGRLDGRDGLAIGLGTQLEIVSVAGVDYALVGAAGSGSLAVIALGSNGHMRVTDHVMDERQTRFAGLTEMASASANGQSYIAVAGSDDGVSLLTLLPGGRLLHLATIEDSNTSALTNPTGLALSLRNGGLDLFVTGGAPTTEGSGISQFHANLGQIGLTLTGNASNGVLSGAAGRDQIIGGRGSERLNGGADDDILVDGAGRDTLTGGAGADVFVLVADGQADVIADFEPGTDRLDLAELGRFYTLDAIGFTATQNGGTFSIGSERVTITTANGRPLAVADLDIADLRDLTHLIVAPTNEPTSEQRGDSGADFLDGRDGADTLIGQGGSDTLIGEAGNDCLLGSTIDELFDPQSAQVMRLYQATLNRDPDINGLLAWTNRLTTQGSSLAQVTSGFVNSTEFRAKYSNADNNSFVTLLYHNVLNREPDSGGLAGWVNQLASGARSREQVVMGFSESLEFRRNTEAEALAFSKEGLQQGYVDDVFRLYHATLGRDPDTAGLHDWSLRLAEGRGYEAVISGFVNSREFHANYGATSNQTFVRLLYANVLDRSPDVAGLSGWLALLASGDRNREQVVAGFAQSQEFIRATAAPLTNWMRGLGTDDVLTGGQGDDVMFGGMFSDNFAFTRGGTSHDRVQGFEAWDRLSFDGFGYTTPNDVRSHMHQHSSGVIFSDQGLTVTFLHSTLAQMNDDVFLF